MVGEVAWPELGTRRALILLNDPMDMDADAVEMEQADEVEMVVDAPQLGCRTMLLEVDKYVRQAYCRSAHLGEVIMTREGLWCA